MKSVLENISKKKLIIFFTLLVVMIFFIIITFIPNGIFNFVRNKIQKEESYSLNYDIYKYFEDEDKYKILVVITNPDGIDTVQYDDITLNCYGKKKVGIDHDAVEFQEYNFTIKLCDGTIKNEKIKFEKTRMGKGAYKQINSSDVYVNEPNLEGYESNYTRYLQYSNDVLKPGNWINKSQPTNWYNYRSKQWANIYVESEGVEGYYVWIPRYCYKVDTENQRTDIKFIDVYNRYIDASTKQTIEWQTLKAQGYVIPDAFQWGEYKEIILSGYWMNKYELSELDSYTLSYNITASKTQFFVSSINTNTDKNIATYTYAMDGEIKYTSTTLQNYAFNANVKENPESIINVTALDSNGTIIGSMTKKLEQVEVNKPDLTGFDKDTTFYVYWDDNDVEHSEIPITKDPPIDWYNYSYTSWANIVTRNNGMESYFVWIPRYQYKVNNNNQRTDIRFIEGISTQTDVGYKIPDAFTFGGKELTGYWISKYELSSDEVTAKLRAEITASDNTLNVLSLAGTAVTSNTKYEYYLNGDKKYEGLESNYKFENLANETEYTITIIARNKKNNNLLGALTVKDTTKPVNKPRFDGFETSKTYYVLYDNNGNRTIGDHITLDGNNMPNKWYDYSDKKWANIVVTDGTVQNGTIQGATSTSYFVWIPRYQYYLDTVNQRTKIEFLKDLSTQTNTGYKIPDAFTFDGKQLYGYWMSKYELSE